MKLRDESGTKGDDEPDSEDESAEMEGDDEFIRTRKEAADAGVTLELFTDGSGDGEGGWGVWGISDTGTATEMSGPVIIDPQDFQHEGAEVATNNTAELTGILEAMREACDEGGVGTVLVRYDSEYAARMATGHWRAKKNLELVRSVQEAVAEARVRRRVLFMHVKGHSGAYGNEKADRLAARGVRERLKQRCQREAAGAELGWVFGVPSRVESRK